ncbi:MAG: hypothetical protein WCY11_12225 [Novosphingobium sp.]
MRNEVSLERSKLWAYTLETNVWTDDDLDNANKLREVQVFMDDRDVPRRKKLEFFTNLNLNYPGTFRLPDGSPTFLDMNVFETKAIDRWFVDWALKARLGLVPRIRTEAKARIKTIGSLMDAYRPLANLYDATKHVTLSAQHPDDWEAFLQANRPRRDC